MSKGLLGHDDWQIVTDVSRNHIDHLGQDVCTVWICYTVLNILMFIIRKECSTEKHNSCNVS